MKSSSSSVRDLRENLNSKRYNRANSNNDDNRRGSNYDLSSTYDKPKVCKVCKRASFLKCMRCETIYCSAVCQVKDWEQHRLTHNKEHTPPSYGKMTRSNNWSSSSSLSKPSVQGRLQIAVNKPVSELFIAKMKDQETKKKLDVPELEVVTAQNHDEISTNSSQQKSKQEMVPNRVNVQSRLKPAVKPLRTPNTKRNEPEELIVPEATVTTPQSKQEDLQQSTHELVKFLKDNIDQNSQTYEIEEMKIRDKSAESSIQEIIDEAIQIMTKNRNFKCFALSGEKDEEQYSLVRVKEIEQLENKPTVFWFQFYEYEQIIDNYKKTLNVSYSSEAHAVIPFDEIVKFKNHLVMAKINGCWSRARIIRYITKPDIVGLEDIDTGYKTIATSGNVIKVPSKSELLKPAFAFKAIIVNLEDPSSVETTNLIKVRITNKNTFGPSEVEVQLANDENESVEPPVKEIDSPVSPVVTQPKNETKSAEQASNRIMFDQLEHKDITLGSEIKLIFCDGSQLDIGKIFVYEALPENSAFYAKLHEEIAAHVKNSSHDLYKPIVRELVLAKFDGFYYRASCVTVSDVEILVDFIDYGNLHTAKPEDIIKMPAHLFYPCCCKAVQLEFSSSRQYYELDVDRTRDLLLGKHEFLAMVESNHLRQFIVTLDDSLVSFK